MSAHPNADNHDHHDDHPHVTPLAPMVIVFVLLLILTGLTVWSANVKYIGFGNSYLYIDSNAHILIALLIASVKGLLVAAYFMHLRYDKPINTVVAAATMFAVTLFIGFTLFDLSNRDTVKPIEGGGAVTSHPYAKPGEATDAAGAIYSGGNLSQYQGRVNNSGKTKFGKEKTTLSIVEYAKEHGKAKHGNHGYGDDHSEGKEGHADDHSDHKDDSH